MLVKEIMHNVTKLPSDTSISKAAGIMDEKSIGSVLIEEDNRIIGIMTERDILKKAVGIHLDTKKIKVKDVMTKKVKKVPINSTVLEILKIMDKGKFRDIPITKNGYLVGIITSHDLIKMLAI